MPAEHHGETVFTFEVLSSESFPISYLTMRDDVLTVTNGEVTGARRLDNPHHESQGMQPNREWEITVAPDSDSDDVTITLPETTDLKAATLHVVVLGARALLGPVLPNLVLPGATPLRRGAQRAVERTWTAVRRTP